MLAPSIIFVSSVMEIFKSDYWEQYNDGDLYAMGQGQRYEEFLSRSGELEGLLIVFSIASIFFFGIYIYFFHSYI